MLWLVGTSPWPPSLIHRVAYVSLLPFSKGCVWSTTIEILRLKNLVWAEES